jgi:hypothetical protein
VILPPLVFPAITYLLGASVTKNEGSSFQEEITTQNEDEGNETVSSSTSFDRKPFDRQTFCSTNIQF